MHKAAHELLWSASTSQHQIPQGSYSTPQTERSTLRSLIAGRAVSMGAALCASKCHRTLTRPTLHHRELSQLCRPTGVAWFMRRTAIRKLRSDFPSGAAEPELLGMKMLP